MGGTVYRSGPEVDDVLVRRRVGMLARASTARRGGKASTYSTYDERIMRDAPAKAP